MTENLSLIKPTLAYSQAIERYREEFSQPINGIAGSSFITSFETVDEWLDVLKRYESKETLPVKDHVTGFQYILVRKNDNKVIGMANVRTELTDYLFNFGGHIGYSICSSERKQDYGKIILKETLKKAEIMGLERLLVTCSRNNLASEKIILSNNGRFENELFDANDNIWVKRHWIDNI